MIEKKTSSFCSAFYLCILEAEKLELTFSNFLTIKNLELNFSNFLNCSKNNEH